MENMIYGKNLNTKINKITMGHFFPILIVIKN